MSTRPMICPHCGDPACRSACKPVSDSWAFTIMFAPVAAIAVVIYLVCRWLR